MILLTLLNAVTNGYPCDDCPTECGISSLPAYQSNICLDAVDCRDSNIEYIYLKDDDGSLTPPTDSCADMENIAWWAGQIDNTGDGGMRCLCVDASLAKPTNTKVQVSQKLGEKTLYKTYNLPFSTTDVNDTNYDFYRKLSSCGWSGWMAFQTKGCSLFGFIYVSIDEADVELNAGDNSLELLSGNINWKASCMPPRCHAPEGSIFNNEN